MCAVSFPAEDREKNMKTKLMVLVLLLAVFQPCPCQAKERLNYAPPSLLPYTTREMRSPGFWIDRLPGPDRIILDAEEIAGFNRKTEEAGLITGVSRVGAVYPGQEVSRQLREALDGFIKRRLYDEQGRRSGKRYYARVEASMNIPAVGPDITVRSAFVLRYSDQRLLPVDGVLTENRFDRDFDQIQNSSLDAGTPLAVLHESKDGLWCYGISPSSSGWVKKDRIVFCSREEMRDFLDSGDFYLVVTPKADIYLDSAGTRYYDTIRMGTRFPVFRPGGGEVSDNAFPGMVRIFIPFIDEADGFYFRQAYVRAENVRKGFLPYTPRTVVEQAFKLLHAPYGWGGLNGEQDCSAFLQQVFATVGLTLPRNSGAQAQVGRAEADFSGTDASDAEKARSLREQGVGGASLLYLKGHILLYLGECDGRFYAIHDTSGYRERTLFGERVRDLKKVVVSDLSLGEGSSKGSLFQRLLRLTSLF